MSSTFNIENTTLDNYIKEEKKKKASNRRDAQNKGVRRTGRPNAGGRDNRRGSGRFPTAGPRRLEREHNRDRDLSRNTVNKRRLRVSNLPLNVTNQEIYELFSQFGPLSICKIQYDKLGRSYGTAIVEFNDESPAREARKEYNGAELDGKSISIQLAGSTGSSAPLARRLGGFKDRSRDYEHERRPQRRGEYGRYRRGGPTRYDSWNGRDRPYQKRRFNDRVRNYRRDRSNHFRP